MRGHDGSAKGLEGTMMIDLAAAIALAVRIGAGTGAIDGATSGAARLADNPVLLLPSLRVRT